MFIMSSVNAFNLDQSKISLYATGYLLSDVKLFYSARYV